MTTPKIESRLKAVLASDRKAKGITLINVLMTLAVSVLAVGAIASLKVKQTSQTPAQQQSQAMSRLKQVAVSTIMYASDFDDVFPYVANAKEAKKVIWPYSKDNDVFKSPREGADFRYNANLGGVSMTSIPAPAESVLWYEVAPSGINPVVAYSDGHVKIVQPDKMAELKKRLNEKFARKKNSKPVLGVGN